MSGLRDMGMLKVPENISPDKKAAIGEIINRYNARNQEIDRQNLASMARIGLGSLVSGASFHPILNIPYVGTGLGGAMYDAGQAIVEGDKLGDIAKRAGRGFVIGETVGAVPYVGKGVNKLSGGKIGEGIGAIAERVANTELARNTQNALMQEFNPVQKAITPLKRKMELGISPFSKTESNILFDSIMDGMNQEVPKFINKEVVNTFKDKRRIAEVMAIKDGKYGNAWKDYIKNIPDKEVKEVLNPDYVPRFGIDTEDEIIDYFNSMIETDKIGHGYSGYSMSNNAIDAYDKGNMPLTKWTKNEIINRIKSLGEKFNIPIDEATLGKISLNDLKKSYLTKNGYHHTSKNYNMTDFYNIDIYKLLKDAGADI